MTRQTSTHQKRKTRAFQRRFPSLEFRTAGWLLDCWAERWETRPATDQRNRELLDKLEGLREAILPSKTLKDPKDTYPKQQKVPPELIRHEDTIVQRAVIALVNQLKKPAQIAKQLDTLKNAVCDYQVKGLEPGTSATRPLILDRSDSRFEKLHSRLAKPNPASTEVCYELLGELFAIGAGTVKTHVRAGTDRMTGREPSEAQLYLVAMFMLAARHGTEKGNVAEMSKILKSLFESRYEAKAIYHLARRVSTMTAADRKKPAWVFQPAIDWKTVEAIRRIV